MILLILFLVIIKVLIFKKMNQLHLDNHHNKICPNGYVGFNSDPYDCTAFYMCPDRVQIFCELNHEFDLDTASCIPVQYNSGGNGCTARMYRNLLL
uniref:DekiORF10 n=1 Tax=Dendrolimus kikuchii nucleopolyhedrovirus TaxID=1219875 RepID=V9LSN7_9ABAC|nr:DekiORF10 [Dendrolimus kikuchii nucleopolyhedrovirus]